MANKEWLKAGVDGLTFGERLGDLIANEGITQSQLAEKTGIKQSAISEYINGKKNGTEERAPDCATIIALAQYFSVSTDYLLGQSKHKTQDTNIKVICEYTGLSEKAIESLHIESKDARAISGLDTILSWDYPALHRFSLSISRAISAIKEVYSRRSNNGIGSIMYKPLFSFIPDDRKGEFSKYLIQWGGELLEPWQLKEYYESQTTLYLIELIRGAANGYTCISAEEWEAL